MNDVITTLVALGVAACSPNDSKPPRPDPLAERRSPTRPATVTRRARAPDHGIVSTIGPGSVTALRRPIAIASRVALARQVVSSTL